MMKKNGGLGLTLIRGNYDEASSDWGSMGDIRHYYTVVTPSINGHVVAFLYIQ